MNKVFKEIVKLGVLCSLICSQLTWAACELELGLLAVPALNYDATEQRARRVPISLKIINSGDSDCRGFIEFRAVDGQPQLSNLRGAKLDYMILSAGNSNQQFFDSKTNSSVPHMTLIPVDGSIDFNSALVVVPNQAARSGAYFADIEAVFVLDRGGPLKAAAQLQLSVSVAPSVQANFVGVSRGANQNSASLLALGEIAPRMEHSLGLQLRANSDVDISIMSHNSGQLALQTESVDVRNGIDYRLSINGNPVALQANGFSTIVGAIDPNGLTIPIKLQVEDFKNAPAGDYADTIFFRISGK